MQMGQVYRWERNHWSMQGVWKRWRHGRWRTGVPSSSFSRQMTLRVVSTLDLSCLLPIPLVFLSFPFPLVLGGDIKETTG